MDTPSKAPTLRIYVSQHCPTCAEARRLADEVRRAFAGMRLELIDLDQEGSQNLDNVFSVPTYLLNGRTFSLGNPTPDELFSRITAELSQSPVDSEDHAARQCGASRSG